MVFHLQSKILQHRRQLPGRLRRVDAGRAGGHVHAGPEREEDASRRSVGGGVAEPRVLPLLLPI